MKVLALVANCKECPNRCYYSGGQYTCTKADALLSDDCAHRLPEWCPLAEYPAAAMSRLTRENFELRKQLADIGAAKPSPKEIAMPSTGDLKALLERARAATGADRELDAALQRSFGPLIPTEYYTESDTVPVENLSYVIRFTASIDAAVALVERALPGWTVASITQDDYKHWHVELRNGYLTSYDNVVISTEKDGKGKPLPLAIIVAFLSAMITREAIVTDTPIRSDDLAGLSAAARDVLAERRRQIEAEGWTAEHDDTHTAGEMAAAASCYALATVDGRKSKMLWLLRAGIPLSWPWDAEWWKRGPARQMLVKAGALTPAEIERLDRAAHLTKEASDAP